MDALKKILIAEDSLVVQKKLAHQISKWGYEVESVRDGEAARERLLCPDSPRLALLDWEMPGCLGPEVCHAVRAEPDLAYRYLILLTGRDSESDLVAGLEAGADDFIRKPWAQAELRARLGVGNRMLLLQQQLEEHSRELLRASQIDPLTQILNRGTVIGRFEAELRRAKREQHPLTVLMIDVDHFKAINDTHGHAMGDEVLKAVAYHLESACRVYDVVGRYGGEEFLAVIPSACREEAEHVAKRLREAVARARVTLHGQTVSVTASIGGAWLSAERDCNGDDLLKRADDKLYEAKENGRNRLEMTVFED